MTRPTRDHEGLGYVAHMRGCVARGKGPIPYLPRTIIAPGKRIASIRTDLHHEGVGGAAAVDRLERAFRRREVAGECLARHVGVRRGTGVHCDAYGEVVGAAAEIRGIDQSRARSIQLRHKHIAAASEGGLERAWGRGEDSGVRGARYVGVAGHIHRNVPVLLEVVGADTAEVGRIDKPGPSLIEFCHEGVIQAAAFDRLEGPRCSREIADIGSAHHVGVPGSIHGDAKAHLILETATAEKRGIDQGGARRIQLDHEGAYNTPRRLVCSRRCREEVGVEGDASHIGVARGIHGDAISSSLTNAPQVGGVDEGRAGGIQLGREPSAGVIIYSSAAG